ncbi:primosomal protein N' [Desulfobacterales bacterium HSG16]|nr:primosomal protein N' [Desulfobacterales bacterium HSG16]
MRDNTFIEVAVCFPVDSCFTYEVPESQIYAIGIGKRVLVPFASRRLTGYVMGFTRNTGKYKIRHILDVLDDLPLFPESMIPFFKWISNYYIHPIGEVIQSALPKGINISDNITLSITDRGKEALQENLVSPPLSKDILKTLAEKGPRLLKAFNKGKSKPISHSLVRKMENSGWITKTRTLSSSSAGPRTDKWINLADLRVDSENLLKSQKKIMDILASDGKMPLKDLRKKTNAPLKNLKKMEAAGYICLFDQTVSRDPFGEVIEPDTPPELTVEQGQAVKRVCDKMGQGYTGFLLAGVTGSGKTEVYMRIADNVIQQDKTVLVLVPEIALISQVERRFKARFGKCVAVLHSGLSIRERYEQWIRIADKSASIVIGVRSAVFAPCENLGIIIVDEEHDSSYKQERDLFYNARDLALVRASQQKCVALLGSATPSIQSSYNVRIKKMSEISLKRRVRSQPLPDVDIIDLRKTKDMKGMRRFITPELFCAMKEALARKEQILLFLNRRGFASFPVCASCEEPLKCLHCDITLTLHRSINAYMCHYCGFTRAFAAGCPVCGSKSVKQLGFGTEKIEGAVSALFPEAVVDRMDRDTTRKKGTLLSILKRLKNRETDILIGTQMVAKGHDFPGITLVGIICADLSLSFPDFRAGERTFQLLAQVAGRAGRGDNAGKVILQTSQPAHYAIAAAKEQNWRSLYKKEIGYRQMLDYPPFSRMAQLRISAKIKDESKKFAEDLANGCMELKKVNPLFSKSILIMGPVEASVFRVENRHRFQILLKSRTANALGAFIRELKKNNPKLFAKPGIHIAIDVDPSFMF